MFFSRNVFIFLNKSRIDEGRNGRYDDDMQMSQPHCIVLSTKKNISD